MTASARSTRSNTCRASKSCALPGSSRLRQCWQCDASCRTIRLVRSSAAACRPCGPSARRSVCSMPPAGSRRSEASSPVRRSKALRTRRTVLSEPPLQFRHLRLQRRDLAAKRRNPDPRSRRENYPYLDLHPARPVSQNPPIKPAFPHNVQIHSQNARLELRTETKRGPNPLIPLGGAGKMAATRPQGLIPPNCGTLETSRKQGQIVVYARPAPPAGPYSSERPTAVMPSQRPRSGPRQYSAAP